MTEMVLGAAVSKTARNFERGMEELGLTPEGAKAVTAAMPESELERDPTASGDQAEAAFRAGLTVGFERLRRTFDQVLASRAEAVSHYQRQRQEIELLRAVCLAAEHIITRANTLAVAPKYHQRLARAKKRLKDAGFPRILRPRPPAQEEIEAMGLDARVNCPCVIPAAESEEDEDAGLEWKTPRALAREVAIVLEGQAAILREALTGRTWGEADAAVVQAVQNVLYATAGAMASEMRRGQQGQDEVPKP